MNKSKEIEVLVLITLVGLLLFSAVLEANAFRRVRRDSSSASASGSQQQMDMGNSSSAMNQSSEAASFS
jgi:hypothetical protein